MPETTYFRRRRTRQIVVAKGNNIKVTKCLFATRGRPILLWSRPQHYVIPFLVTKFLKFPRRTGLKHPRRLLTTNLSIAQSQPMSYYTQHPTNTIIFANRNHIVYKHTKSIFFKWNEQLPFRIHYFHIILSVVLINPSYCCDCFWM